MTAVRKQDSNFTSLRFCEEASIGVAPVNPTLAPLAPNSYKSFGGKYKSVARNPINSSRQRLKGVITDLDAMADFQSDMTYENTQGFMQGVLFANYRTKAELNVASVDSAAGYEPATGGTGYLANDLVFGKGFQLAANNGLHLVTGTPTASSVEFAGMASESGSAGIISRVGIQFAASDASFVTTGPLPALQTTAKDMTTLGLTPGEWVFIGDDLAANSFLTTGITGFYRVSTIAAHVMTFDKWEYTTTPASDTGTGQTVRMYFSRVLRNEQQALIVRRTYTFERQLPPSDTTSTTNQAEYVVGSAIDTFMLTVNTADKVTWDVSAMANNYIKNPSSVGPITAVRPALNETQAFNTSSEVRRAMMSIVGTPTPLFGYLSTIALTIKNNIKQNKSIAVLGAFDQTAGMLDVSMAVDCYFTDLTAIEAISNNSNVTVDLILAHDNTGIVYDLPLVALGDGQPDVKANEPITLKLTVDAASATIVNPNFDYTLMVNFFDYLPTVAM